MSYNAIVRDAAAEVRKIAGFIGVPGIDEAAMVAAVAEKLYRKRRPQ